MTRTLYSGKVEPILTPAQRPEQVTESRWHQPWSDPVRQKINPVLAVALIASGLFFTPSAPFPETVTESRWHQPWSEPVRFRVAQQSHLLVDPLSVFQPRDIIGNDPLEWMQPPRPRSAAYYSDWFFPPQQTTTTAVTWNAWTQWPDIVSKAKPIVDFRPWTFVEPPPQVWFPPDVYPDIVPIRAKPVPDFIPWAFLEPAPQVWYPPDVYPDSVPAARRTVDLIPWTFLEPPPQVWYPPSVYPDIDPVRAKPVADFIPWTFIPSPIQVWYPSDRWPDFAPTFKRPVEFQSLTFPPQQTVAAAPTWTTWTPWPDLVPTRPKPVIDFTAWTFLEPAPQVWYPFDRWPDTAPAFKRTSDFPAIAFVAPQTPWTQWSPWPDIVPFRAKPTVDFQPWTFIEPPPQVWYPPDRWPDMAPAAKRVAQNPDWSYGTFITPSFIPTYTQWTQWPDFALRAKATVDFIPWTFLEPPPQVWFPPSVYPDSVLPAKRVPEFPALAFVAPQTPWTQWSPWPDIDPFRAKPAIDFIPWTFIPSPIQVWYPPNVVPDIVPVRTKPVPDFIPWTFVPPPAQVWFPVDRWPDTASRKPQPVDTQPAAFVSVVAPTAVTLTWVQWPDFASKKAAPLNYDPLTFIQTVTTPVNGFIQWPDFVYKKATPLNYDPLTLVQTVVTPWNAWTQWPDFAQLKGKTSILTGAHQFSAFWPGKITASVVTLTMSAFEVNTDGAAAAIFVIQSKPAVKAAVSIKEIGILGGSINP